MHRPVSTLPNGTDSARICRVARTSNTTDCTITEIGQVRVATLAA
jgi:hypothetical protein